jgi:hypothetical protein
VQNVVTHAAKLFVAHILRVCWLFALKEKKIIKNNHCQYHSKLLVQQTLSLTVTLRTTFT